MENQIQINKNMENDNFPVVCRGITTNIIVSDSLYNYRIEYVPQIGLEILLLGNF